MKKITKLYILLACFAFTTACSDLVELDEFLVNPNVVTPENAGIDFVYTNVQLTFRNIVSTLDFNTSGLVRQMDLGAFTYLNAMGENVGNGAWLGAYSTLFPDIDVLLDLSAANGFDIHAGSAKIMKAYSMMMLVDLFGDVPFSEAGQGTDVISPKLDDGASVYAAAEALLDEAIAQLTSTNAGAPSSDLYYGGDKEKWIAAANSIKIKLYNNTRLVDGAAGSKIAAIVSSANIIDTPEEDLVFRYGNNRVNPNSRHPYYTLAYEAADAPYISNYFLWSLCCEKEVQDPRTRLYFYRQVDNSNTQDLEVYSCHLSDLPTDLYPDHYEDVDANLPYCTASPNGWYGRDHGNGSGIPPDGPVRTVYGLYPGGGRWDGDFFEFSQSNGTTGGLGQGIQPILLSSFVDFMRAEAALTANSGEDARALLESGVRASIAKALSLESIDAANINSTREGRDGDINLRDRFWPSDSDVDEYVDVVLARYDAGDKLDVVVKEAMIAMWGNGGEFFNMYRRTGLPSNIQPGVDNQTIITGNEGFPRTLLYPAVFVNRNGNVTQKADLSTPTFWDNSSATLR